MSRLEPNPAVSPAAGLLAFALCWLALCAPAHAARRYYLALGDSDAFGFQFRGPGVPARDYHTGYDGAQLKAALSFLLTHPLRTDLITLTLWGNDVNAFLAGRGGDFVCVQAGAPAAIARFSVRLGVILAAVRVAAGPRATIVLTGPYDPNPQPLAQLTHPLYLALDAAMRTVAARTGVRYAALFSTFDSDLALCNLTLFCSSDPPDAHPSDAGYQAIADLILQAAGS